MIQPLQRPFTATLALLFCAAAFATTAEAGARRFTYVYEATTSAPGTFELENWVTWKDNDDESDEFDFRHEIEFGITDRLQLALYVADWTHSDDEGSKFEDAAVEVMYNLTNPETTALGSALYGEIKIGDELVELEGKIILQKNFGPLIVAYNGTIEAEWEGDDLDEQTGEFQQTAGVSYQVTPQFLVGAELLHEIELPEWEEAEDSVVYAGPNASVRIGNLWATATALAQLTDTEEPDFQVRTIVGYSF